MLTRIAGILFLSALALAARPSRPIPMFFEPNMGQTDADTAFLARGPGYAVHFGSGGVSLIGAERTIRMHFVGATPALRIRGQELQDGKAHYFVGDRDRWRTDVPLYSKVEYSGVYPGVNLIFYGNGGQLEYDFSLAPGARVSQIRLSFDGAESVRIEGGDLVLNTASGKLRHRRPRIYQERNGRTVEVAGRFVLRGPREAGFEVASYDRSRKLVIDPALAYATYVGGAGNDTAWAAAVDSAGCAYVVGETSPVSFPRTFTISTSTGNQDAFIVKLNSSGTGIVYATYFGGRGRDSARGVSVDSAGNAYVTGFSNSTDFPTTTAAYRTKLAGQEDAFALKLNASGSRLVYSTLIGGGGSDFATGIAVDASGNAYIAGYTSSLAFPVTSGALQRSFGGGLQDAFVAKLNASGSGLLYSTYLGGAGADIVHGIAVDSLGFAYLAGYTDSSNFPLQNALQATAGGQGDAFVAKLNPGGDGLAYATYLGGRLADSATAVAVNADGYAYVTGSTSSSDFPVTAGAFQTASHGAYDAFVSKLNPSGNALLYSTYLGGEASEEAEGIAIDASGAAYIAGFTGSLQFPTQNPVDSGPHGGLDAFATAVSPDGSSLSWSTYLGGAAEDRATGIAIDPAGGLYIAGYTLSPDLRTSPGAYRTAYTPGGDAFIAKLAALAAPQPPRIVSLTPASGSATTATLSLVASDPNGASDVTTAYLLVSNGLTQPSACYVSYDHNAFSLMNDDASLWLGPVAAGSAATLQNSQCTLDVAHSSISASGNSLTVTFAITFKSAFSGDKQMYVRAMDAGRLDTGWQLSGTWSIARPVNQPPGIVSLTPASGTGTTTTLSLVASDPNGASDVTTTYLLVSNGFNYLNACVISYDSDAFWLLNDSATLWLGPLRAGSAATLQNSQCTLDGAHSSISTSGNSLTMNSAITFKAAFAGAKQIYVRAMDAGRLDTGWQLSGNWGIASLVNQPPEIASLTPASGTGTTTTLSLVASDPNGASDVTTTYLLVSNGFNYLNTCVISYDSNAFWLLNDNATLWLGPLRAGSAATLQNSQCTLDGAHSSISASGNSLTMNSAITFKAAFAGAKQIYVRAMDAGRLDTGWQLSGNWGIASLVNQPPEIASLTPASGTGTITTLSLVASDPNGASDVTTTYLLVSNGFNYLNTCVISYDSNAFWLLNDSATLWLGPLRAGSAATLQNSQCTLDGAHSSISASGNSLTMNSAITFKAAFAGAKQIYVRAMDASHLDTGWQLSGNWTVR